MCFLRGGKRMRNSARASGQRSREETVETERARVNEDWWSSSPRGQGQPHAFFLQRRCRKASPIAYCTAGCRWPRWVHDSSTQGRKRVGPCAGCALAHHPRKNRRALPQAKAGGVRKERPPSRSFAGEGRQTDSARPPRRARAGRVLGLPGRAGSLVAHRTSSNENDDDEMRIVCSSACLRRPAVLIHVPGRVCSAANKTCVRLVYQSLRGHWDKLRWDASPDCWCRGDAMIGKSYGDNGRFGCARLSLSLLFNPPSLSPTPAVALQPQRLGRQRCWGLVWCGRV